MDSQWSEWCDPRYWLDSEFKKSWGLFCVSILGLQLSYHPLCPIELFETRRRLVGDGNCSGEGNSKFEYLEDALRSSWTPLALRTLILSSQRVVWGFGFCVGVTSEQFGTQLRQSPNLREPVAIMASWWPKRRSFFFSLKMYIYTITFWFSKIKLWNC